MGSEHKTQSKKKSEARPAPTPPWTDVHGARELPAVLVEGYSLQLRGGEGFLGDQASQTAFRELLERWRRRHRKKRKKDPLGERHSRELAKGTLDAALKEGKASEATDVVHAAIEEFAEALADVIRSFLRQPSWKGVQRIVIGGGFPESDVGERAVLQAAAILQELKVQVELARISHETDDGGLLGWVHLAPPELLEHYDAILALDIGGTNVRCGIVKTRRKRAPDLSQAKVLRREKWRHADEGPNRRVLVARLADMLEEQVRYCKKKGIRLAPFVGIGCPGLIRKDGSIARGAQNMPGDWTSEHFHLPTALARKIPTIRGVPTMVLMHNDAVVQGLSELPFMRDVKHWAVLTIGTGLGNASYSNREPPKKSRGA
ncbi:ROK family protein [Variovorax soli]|uniref:NBD/HSP70 family sugar kinase n=1 Tax=Variovorax soli TaxID=376815 RepID=A0ABU1NJK7_9BURK|nr:ROK family protein [Variovorax soli]MDR6538170.1 putative NBD/HSP70 family sugar kinase [Variovorax soli]